MFPQTEYSELEKRLQQSRPPVEPLSPTFKRRLRAHLMEQAQMEQKQQYKPRFRPAVALATLVVILGIPLLFWSILSSVNRDGAAQGALPTTEPTAVLEDGSMQLVPTIISTPAPPDPTPFADPVGENHVAIIGSTPPRLLAGLDPVAEPVYEIGVTLQYTLTGYAEAALVAAYEFEDEAGGTMGAVIIPIEEGGGTVEGSLALHSDFISEDGSALKEGVELVARINVFDEALGEYVNLYPGDATLSANEKSLRYPLQQDGVIVRTLYLNEDEHGMTILTAELLPQLTTKETATMHITLQDEQGNIVALEEVELNEETSDQVLSFSAETAELDQSATLTLNATINHDDQELASATRTVILHDFQVEAVNKIWLVEVVEAAEEGAETAANDDPLPLILRVGYNLSDLYDGGTISFTTAVSSQSTAQGGGGGGGGGGQSILPGVGLIEFVIPFTPSPGAEAADWRNLLSVTVEFTGQTIPGRNTALDTVEWEPAE